MEVVNEQDKLLWLATAEQERKKADDEKKIAEKIFYESDQFKQLTVLSWITFSLLGLVIAVTGFVIVRKWPIPIVTDLIWIAIISGVLGSSCSALLSALERKANGWEDKKGNKYPNDEPRDKFSQRMATFFLFRPFFGILAGLIIYFGMQAKLLGDTGISDPAKVIFWSLLSGLFIKTLMEKLKDVFENLVGKK